MASIGHVAVGMAAARAYEHDRAPRWRAAAFWSALSLLPDADVVGFALGVPYADPWGHRGATHSLVFAIALGAAVGLAVRRFNRPAGRTPLVATAVLASHGLLDTMTDGGLGCALLWPFDLTRYFAPWRPIAVAPIGLDFLSAQGAVVALYELVLFSPLFVFSLRSRRSRANRALKGTLLGLWVAAVWLIASRDPMREATVGLLLREDTAYTAAFSERAFRAIKPGASELEVRQVLGPPFRERWLYLPKGEPLASAATISAESLPPECLAISFEAGVVAAALNAAACSKAGVEPGMSLMDTRQVLGEPGEKCWEYTWSPRGGHYRLRMVCLVNSRVEAVIRQWQ